MPAWIFLALGLLFVIGIGLQVVDTWKRSRVRGVLMVITLFLMAYAIATVLPTFWPVWSWFLLE